MKKMAVVLAMLLFACPWAVLAAAPVTEDFETGYTDGEPLRVHADWFFGEGKDSPTCEDDAGIGGKFGVSNGDRAFTWVAKSLNFNDSGFAAVTVGGDWQTDADGKLDDDRAGWSISNESDSSDNIFGVQMDPGGEGESGLNIEAYWDGDEFGDDGGRTSIVDLPELEADTWYRLRAKFTKLTDTTVKIDVTFVELDEAGEPTGEVTKGSIADTSKLPNTKGEETPNAGYFTPTTVWPVLKNFGNLEGGFDNAYFELETASGTSSSGAAESAVEEKPAVEKAPAEEATIEESPATE